MTLTDFLLARIAEDQAELDYARAHWMHGDDRFHVREFHQQFNADDMRVDLGYGRARAECEAKRRIVEHRALDADKWADGYNCAIEDALRLLALPYADHPDYDEGWRP